MRRSPVVPALILACGLAWPTTAAGQVIRGSVIDGETQRPVADVAIEILDSRGRPPLRVVTDRVGGFAVVLPGAGMYRLMASHVAYMRYESAVLTVNAGEILTIMVRLGREALPLEPLLVVGRVDARMIGFEERRRTSMGHFITRSEIESRRPARITELLRDVPGIALRRVGATSSLVQMRAGTRGCFPTIWVDGVQMRQYSGSTLDDMLLPNVLEGVEIYLSSASAPIQWNTGSGCGVIAFWTRQSNRDEGRARPWVQVAAGVGAVALLLLLFQ